MSLTAVGIDQPVAENLAACMAFIYQFAEAVTFPELGEGHTPLVRQWYQKTGQATWHLLMMKPSTGQVTVTKQQDMLVVKLQRSRDVNSTKAKEEELLTTWTLDISTAETLTQTGDLDSAYLMQVVTQIEALAEKAA